MRIDDVMEAKIMNHETIVTEVVVAGSGSAHISIPFERGPFQPTGIVVPADVARHFLVTEISVGKNSQFIAPACVPASFFSERREDLSFESVPRGMLLTLSVSNTDSTDHVFKCSVKGKPGLAPASKRRAFLGLGQTFVPAGSVVTLRVQPQVTFKPDLFVLPEELLEIFEVVELRVVGDGKLLQSSPEKSEWVILDAAKMQVGDWLSVVVKNKTGGDRRFVGTIVGDMTV
jgi:hypothetical protein